MAGYTLLICTLLSLLSNCDGSSNGVVSKSLKEVPEMRGRESTVAVLATYTGTTSTAECGVRCLENNMCWSFFMNKPLQQCRLNHRVLTPDITNSAYGWKYYERSSSKNEDSGISTSIPEDSGIFTSTTADSGISTSDPPETTSSPESCTRGSYCCREGLCLKLFPDQLYWHKASDKCVSLGQRLLVIDSSWKQQLVAQMVQEMGGNDDIGIGGQMINSNWVWQDGREITEFFWDQDHPKSGRNYLTLEDEYGFLWGNTQGSYRPQDYICEKY